MPKDNHRKHQQLMQKLAILNAQIKGHEAHIRKVKGKIPKDQWESLNRDLKKLGEKKAALNREIRRLD